jgi:hypothetical protein
VARHFFHPPAQDSIGADHHGNDNRGQDKKVKFSAAMLIAGTLIGTGACSVAPGEPPTLTVERAAIWSDTVQRGTLTLERRGPGTLMQAEDGTLYADARIPELQSVEFGVGQVAVVDLGGTEVAARVADLGDRISRGLRSVRLEFTGNVPEAALPGMSLSARIRVATIEDTLFVGRPAYGQEGTVISLFRVDDGNDIAVRVPVRVGRSSYNVIEVLDGLDEDDRVILSDTSQWDSVDRLALR